MALDNNNKKKIRNDLILVVALLVLAAAGFVLFSIFLQDGDSAVVMQNGVEIARYPLNEDRVEEIITDLGSNVLVIENGEAYIIGASCPDLICVGHRKISSVGETIACLPNKLVICIEKDAESSLDMAA